MNIAKNALKLPSDEVKHSGKPFSRKLSEANKLGLRWTSEVFAESAAGDFRWKNRTAIPRGRFAGAYEAYKAEGEIVFVTSENIDPSKLFVLKLALPE